MLPHLASHLVLSKLLRTVPGVAAGEDPATALRQWRVQFYRLLKAFSLLLLGMFLSALATLNFSLALLIGLVAAPLTFTPVVGDDAGLAIRATYAFLLDVLSPPAVVAAATVASRLLASGDGGGASVAVVLREAAFGWNVWGLYTPLVVWCVWWPAWLVGSVVVLSSRLVGGAAAGTRQQQKQKAL